MARSTGCDKAIVNAAEEPMWYNHGPDAMAEKTELVLMLYIHDK